MGTTISGSGTLRFSLGGSEGRGRCRLTLVLRERGKESSRNPPELCVLRWLGVLRSPSRELLPSVLPSNSALAWPSFFPRGVWRKEPPSDRRKCDAVPEDRSRSRSFAGDIEDCTGGSFGCCDIAAGRATMLDGNVRERDGHNWVRHKHMCYQPSRQEFKFQ